MALKDNRRNRRGMGAIKRMGIQLLRQGATQADVVRELGVSRTTACNWAAASREDSDAGGSPLPIFSDDDLARLRQLMKDGALAYGFPTDSWTIARVAIMLEWEFALVCNTLHVFRMLGPMLAKRPSC